VLTGKEARELGLIDELGNFEDALDRAASLAGKTGAPIPVFPTDTGGGFLERLLRRAASQTGHGLVDGVREEARPRQSVETRDPRF
jgi:protease-4